MSDIEKYFNKVIFTAFALILPATMYIILILLKLTIPGIKEQFNTFPVYNYDPGLFVYSASYISVFICFINIILLNLRKTGSITEVNLIYRKSLMNTTLIFLNASYGIFIFLYTELEKFGNIPVGRN